MNIENALVKLGYKVWEAGNHKRIYINNIYDYVEIVDIDGVNEGGKIVVENVFTVNGKNFLPINAWKRRDILNHEGKCFYDCKDENFYVTSSCKEVEKVLWMAQEKLMKKVEEIMKNEESKVEEKTEITEEEKAKITQEERMKAVGRKFIIKTKDFYIDALKKNHYRLLNKDIYCKDFKIIGYSFIILGTDSPTAEECYLNIAMSNGQLTTTLEIREHVSSAYVFDIEPVMTFEAAGELYRKGDLSGERSARHLLKLCD